MNNVSVHMESWNKDFSLLGALVPLGTAHHAGPGATSQSRGHSQSCSNSCRSAGHWPHSPKPTQEVFPGGTLSRRPIGHPEDRAPPDQLTGALHQTAKTMFLKPPSVGPWRRGKCIEKTQHTQTFLSDLLS